MDMLKKLFVVMCLFAGLIFAQGHTSSSAESQIDAEREIIARIEQVDNIFTVFERIGNSMYVRSHNIFRGGGGQTRRYMDVTSLMNHEDLIRISERVISRGNNIRHHVAAPDVDVWQYRHNRLGMITVVRDLSPRWRSQLRYDIDIDDDCNDIVTFRFASFPKGSHIFDGWSLDVQGYTEDRVYVVITYHHFNDTMSDEELFESARAKIRLLNRL